jgi:energy-coupling factor transporter ATP-binding protein EcfA2
MDGHVPSLKSTSGAGFGFEDRVAALFLVEMLAGQPSMRPEWGLAWQLRRQVADLNPHDDIVLNYQDVDGQGYQCAVSSKSALVSTRDGFTKKTIAEMWSVFDSASFHAHDHLCIACQPLGDDAEMLDRLLPRSLQTPPEQFFSTLRGEGENRCHQTFEHPTDQARQPASLMRRLVLRHDFDFQQSHSKAESEAIRLCRSLLSSDDDQNSLSRELWQTLQSTAGSLRENGGSRTIPELLNELKNRFPLADAPNDREDWRHVRSITEASLDEVSEKLPTGHHVARGSDINIIHTYFSQQNIFAIMGESGAGKSVLAKLYAQSLQKQSTEVIWLSQPDLNRLKLTAAELVVLIRRCRRSQGLVVLDGAESWHSTTDFAFVRALIGAIVDIVGWKTLITCQQYDWSRISTKLATPQRSNIHTHLCASFSDSDIEFLSAVSPKIKRLASHPRLHDLMRKPQMLRVMLEVPADHESEMQFWTSEVHIADWWWRERVCEGQVASTEGTLARNLACTMADRLEIELPENEADGYEPALNKLIHAGVLLPTRRSTLRFVHDLYTDWSRLRHLRQLGDGLFAFAEKQIENPPWFRTLSLLCQQFLERDEDMMLWRNLVTPLLPKLAKHEDEYSGSRESPAHLRIVDAALEALIRCSHPSKALSDTSEVLLGDSCTPLRRLIRSMCHTATVPDPVFSAMARQNFKLPEAELESFERISRLPQFTVWEPVIEFLTIHQEQVVPSIALELSEIMPMFSKVMGYLKEGGHLTPHWWPSLCELAAACGEYELHWEIDDRWCPARRLSPRFGDPREQIYKATLLAGDQCPDRVAKLALKAAGRIDWEKDDLPKEYKLEWAGKTGRKRYAPLTSDTYQPPTWEVYQPPAWEHGPRRRVSEDFGTACLKGDALAALIQSKPAVVVELVLAFAIKWPKENQKQRSHDTIEEDYGLELNSHDWYPPFWSQGPFMLLFKHAPAHALDLIVRLVNFATDGHLLRRYDRKVEGKSLVIMTQAGTTLWKGDANVYTWSYSKGHNFVISAIMALEKWLLHEVQQKHPITSSVHYLYQHGTSIAFAGLLISVGKAHPDLFLDDLRPLLSVEQFYECDEPGDVRTFLAGGASSLLEPEFVSGIRHEWHSQQHHRVGLKEFCYDLIRTRPEFRPIFAEASQAFQQRAANLDDKEKRALLRLAWTLNFANWIETTHPDGQSGWHTNLPEEILEPQDPVLNREFDIQHIVRQSVRAIQSRQLLNESIAIQWWDVFEQVLKWERKTAPSSENQEKPPDEALAALMAVLLCLGSDWFDKNPAKLDLIEATATSIMPDICAEKNDLADRGRTDIEVFMALVVIRIWASGRNPVVWRGHAGRFAMAFRYGVVRVLFFEAYMLQLQLASGFSELCRLMLAYSEQRGPEGFFPETLGKKGASQQRWRDEWGPRFASGLCPVVPTLWGTSLGTDPSLPQNQIDGENDSESWSKPFKDKNPKRLDYGFDVGLAVAALDCIPTAERALNDSLNEPSLSNDVEGNLFAALLKTLPDNFINDSDKAPQACGNDNAILRRIAIRTLVHDAPKDELPYWQRLLAKGPNSIEFARSFADELKSEHRRLGISINKLQAVWTSMLDFLLASNEWKPLDKPNRYDLWDDLLFIGRFMPSSPGEHFAPLIVSLVPYYHKTVLALKPWGFRFQRYLHFFASEAAIQPLIPEVIRWLHPVIMSPIGINWKESRIRSALSAIADEAWKHRRQAVRANADSFACFKSIVNSLAAMQDPVGIQIQSTL